MRYAQFPSQQHYPENVADQAADSEVACFYLPAKGPKHKTSYLKTLQAERNADNG